MKHTRTEQRIERLDMLECSCRLQAQYWVRLMSEAEKDKNFVRVADMKTLANRNILRANKFMIKARSLRKYNNKYAR